jgi:hypothetical protein
MDGATEKHWKDLLSVIKWTLDTECWKLRFKPKMKNGTWKLEAYSDSDWAGDKDSRISVTGYILYLCGVPITWKSRGQRSVTLSSTEAEYVALSEVTCEILFIRQILEFMGTEIEYPIVINVDNQGAVFMANNRTTSQRTRHVDTRHHFVREYIEDGVVKVIYCNTNDNDADPYTKNVNEQTFLKNVEKYMWTGTCHQEGC